MKYVFKDNKIVVYLNKENINFDITNKENLEEYIKELVLNIKKIYSYKISGRYNVNIYENKKIGLIIEFIKKESFDFFPDLIDLKLNVFYDSDVYLKLDDYFLIKKYKNIYYNNNNFYVNVDDLIKKDILILSEFGKYIYGIKLKKVKEKLNLLNVSI